MKLQLFEYVVLLHPKPNEKGETSTKTEIVKEVTRLLAKDSNQVGMLAAREIPQEHLDHLERVEIIVRPF